MARLIKSIFLTFLFFFCATLVFAEDITITTYYPSPYGSYNILQSKVLGVGDNNGDASYTSADAPSGGNDGEVWIKGKVGIGVTSPTNALDVGGLVGASSVPGNTIGIMSSSVTTDSMIKIGESATDYGFAAWRGTDNYFQVGTNGTTRHLIFSPTGNVGIATTTPGQKLEVIGTVKATAFSATTAGAGAYMYNTSTNMNLPDYVFDKDYKLMSLPELKKYVSANKHLPGLLSSQELKKSGTASLVEQDFKNLEKIEELVLYILQLKSENEALRSRVDKLEARGKTK